MNAYALIENLLIFFQDAITTLGYFVNWLWTPWQQLADITGVKIAPIALFGASAIITILVFHIAHLVNVISG